MKKLLLLLTFLIFCIVFLLACSDNPQEIVDDNIYIGEMLSYEDLEIVVKNINCEQILDKSSSYYGLYKLDIHISLKNCKDSSFDFSFDEFHIETFDSHEKYTISYYGDTISDIFSDVFLGETIIAGATKTYDIRFYTPYSINDKHFVLYIDWGFLSIEQSYQLYNRDGTVFTNTPAEDTNTSTENNIDATILNLQNDIYNIFISSVYPNISDGMTYSDVQFLMDYTESQLKDSLPQINIDLDITSGQYHPRWIVSVNADRIYALVYVKVDLNSNYYCTHKYIGKFTIS